MCLQGAKALAEMLKKNEAVIGLEMNNNGVEYEVRGVRTHHCIGAIGMGTE